MVRGVQIHEKKDWWLFQEKMSPRVREWRAKRRLCSEKVVPPRIELGSWEPKPHMLPLHHGTPYKDPTWQLLPLRAKFPVRTTPSKVLKITDTPREIRRARRCSLHDPFSFFDIQKRKNGSRWFNRTRRSFCGVSIGLCSKCWAISDPTWWRWCTTSC